MPIKALLGFHDPNFLKYIGECVSEAGFSPILTMTEGEMDSHLFDPQIRLCMMDINLGDPGSSHTDSSWRIYNTLIPRIHDGSVIFIATSYAPEALKSGKGMGMPHGCIVSKQAFEELYGGSKYLKSLFDQLGK